MKKLILVICVAMVGIIGCNTQPVKQSYSTKKTSNSADLKAYNQTEKFLSKNWVIPAIRTKEMVQDGIDGYVIFKFKVKTQDEGDIVVVPYNIKTVSVSHEGYGLKKIAKKAFKKWKFFKPKSHEERDYYYFRVDFE